MKKPLITLSRGDAQLLGRACLLWAERLGYHEDVPLDKEVDFARIETRTQLLYLQSRLYDYATNYPEYEREEGNEEVDRSDIPF